MTVPAASCVAAFGANYKFLNKGFKKTAAAVFYKKSLLKLLLKLKDIECNSLENHNTLLGQK